MLQLDIQREHHGVARRGGVARQPPHRAPASRGLHLLHAGYAVELVLITLLHAELAYVLRAAVIGRVIPLLNRLFFGLVDAPDVADHMAGQFTVGIAAKQARLDFHAWEAEPLCRKAGHLRFGQAATDRQGLKTAGLFHQLFESAPVTRADIHQGGQGLYRLLQIGGFGGGYLQGVG